MLYEHLRCPAPPFLLASTFVEDSCFFVDIGWNIRRLFSLFKHGLTPSLLCCSFWCMLCMLSLILLSYGLYHSHTCNIRSRRSGIPWCTYTGVWSWFDQYYHDEYLYLWVWSRNGDSVSGCGCSMCWVHLQAYPCYTLVPVLILPHFKGLMQHN